MTVHTPSRGFFYHLLDRLNRFACRVMYGVQQPVVPPLPVAGPVLLVSDHSSFNDPMVLAATAQRPLIFLTAREVYEAPYLKPLCQFLQYIPVSRGTQDIGAVRSMIRALKQGEVITIFPEGGIVKNREEDGHSGIGYLALKTGAPVVPVSIAWDSVRPLSLGKSLLTRGRALVRYGSPIVMQSITQPDREEISIATTRIMQAIRELNDLSSSPSS